MADDDVAAASDDAFDESSFVVSLEEDPLSSAPLLEVVDEDLVDDA
ncbi:MAG: hypothetical protein WD377_07285 [Nitriliruptoraceae bacterium]